MTLADVPPPSFFDLENLNAYKSTAVGTWAIFWATAAAAFFTLLTAGFAIYGAFTQNRQLRELKLKADDDREDRKATIRAATPEFIPAENLNLGIRNAGYPTGIQSEFVVWDRRDEARHNFVAKWLSNPAQPLLLFCAFRNRLRGTDPLQVQVAMVDGPENVSVGEWLEEAHIGTNPENFYTLEVGGITSQLFSGTPIRLEFTITLRTGHIVKQGYELQIHTSRDVFRRW